MLNADQLIAATALQNSDDQRWGHPFIVTPFIEGNPDGADDLPAFLLLPGGGSSTVSLPIIHHSGQTALNHHSVRSGPGLPGRKHRPGKAVTPARAERTCLWNAF